MSDMKLMLVDGSNMVMRCAYGGELQPEVAVPSATGQISRIIEAIKATHMVICMDTPDFPSWRKKAYPQYKAHRKYSTAMWLEAAASAWAQRGWHVSALPGYEADDLIATLANRSIADAQQRNTPMPNVHVISNDSDLLPLIGIGCHVHRPGKIGELKEWDEADVQERYGCSAAQLPDLKALMGESGDNLPGAKGIGEVGAMNLIQHWGNIGNVVSYTRGCEKDPKCAPVRKLMLKVKASLADVKLTHKLATLAYDAPVPNINPKECEL